MAIGNSSQPPPGPGTGAGQHSMRAVGQGPAASAPVSVPASDSNANSNLNSKAASANANANACASAGAEADVGEDAVAGTPAPPSAAATAAASPGAGTSTGRGPDSAPSFPPSRDSPSRPDRSDGDRSQSSSKRGILSRFIRRIIPKFSSASSSTSSSPSEDTTTTTTASHSGASAAPRPSGQPQVSSQRTTTADHENNNTNANTNMAPAPLPASAIPSLAEITNRDKREKEKENKDKEKKAAAIAAADLGGALARVSLEDAPEPPQKSAASYFPPLAPRTPDNDGFVEKPIHQVFMEQALDMARLALRTNETPVGCVLVQNGVVVAKGMNATNVTRNGTRHAEYMAISALLSYLPPRAKPDNSLAEPRHVPPEMSPEAAAERKREKDAELGPDPSINDSEYVRSGHLYPYGQKIHPDPRVPRHIIHECDLYVTVEPCVMCAGLLRQLGIRKVYFGAVNDKFGGTGGVFSIHMNSIRPQDKAALGAKHGLSDKTNANDGSTNNASAPAPSTSRPASIRSQSSQIPAKTPGGQYHVPMSNPDGDGGNVEPGFEIEGGWGRDEAVGLLRRFYVQENGRAPQPRKKEGRAARLAALEAGGNGTLEPGETPKEADDDAAATNVSAGAAAAAVEGQPERATNSEIPVQTPTLGSG